MQRRPRRAAQERRLEELSSDQLWEVWHFGNLMADPETVRFTATEEQQAEAGRLLRERGER